MFDRKTHVTNIYVDGFTVQPGDMVILAADKRLTREQFERIKAQFAEAAPDVKVVVTEEMQMHVLREL